MPTEKKHNIFYRTTNQINWKYYFGIHSTNNLDDGYLGSGKIIKDAILKHGIENFTLTIIQDYPTRKEASDHEKLAVTQFQVEDPMCYNLKTGGDNECRNTKEWALNHSKKVSGEGNGMFGRKHKPETLEKISLANTGRGLGTKRQFSDEWKENISKGSLLSYQNGRVGSFQGRTHSEESNQRNRQSHLGKKASEETRRKLSEARKGKTGRAGKSCSINGVEYKSIRLASKDIEMSPSRIRSRLKSDDIEFSTWFYLTEWKVREYSDETWKTITQMACKKVQIDDVVFNSMAEAATFHKVIVQTVRTRIKSTKDKWKNWIDYVEE